MIKRGSMVKCDYDTARAAIFSMFPQIDALPGTQVHFTVGHRDGQGIPQKRGFDRDVA